MYLPLYKIADTHVLIQSDKITNKISDCCRGLDYAVNCYYCKLIWRQNASLWDGYIPLANLVRCMCYLIWLYAFYLKKTIWGLLWMKTFKDTRLQPNQNWTNVGSMLSQRRNSTGLGNTIRGNVMMVYRLLYTHLRSEHRESDRLSSFKQENIIGISRIESHIFIPSTRQVWILSRSILDLKDSEDL